jgi:hypothetical protein
MFERRMFRVAIPCSRALFYLDKGGERGIPVQPDQATSRAGAGADASALQSRGLDPDKWFNHVELVTAEKIGIQTTGCVRNIYKAYVSYRLNLDTQADRVKAVERLGGDKKKWQWADRVVAETARRHGRALHSHIVRSNSTHFAIANRHCEPPLSPQCRQKPRTRPTRRPIKNSADTSPSCSPISVTR